MPYMKNLTIVLCGTKAVKEQRMNLSVSIGAVIVIQLTFAAMQRGEPMDDLISRQAAIDAFLTELTKRERKNLLHTWSTVEVKYFVVDMLEKLPSAQPERTCVNCGRTANNGGWYADGEQDAR